MIPEREREALMRLTMCAREECGMCKYEDTCDFDFQYETATRCMNILADALRTADRKTEPQTESDGMTYIKWLEDNCLHILDVSWICDEMHEYPEEWEYCSRNCNDGSAECLKRLYRASSSSEKPNNCELEWNCAFTACEHYDYENFSCKRPPKTDCAWK